MNWAALALQIVGSLSLSAIGAWFLYDLVSEFKDFKKEARRDIAELAKERASFLSTVRQAELNFALRVTDIQKIHQEFSTKAKESMLDFEADLQRINFLMDSAINKTSQLDTNFQKILLVIKRHEDVLKSMKIQIDDLIIFKGQK